MLDTEILLGRPFLNQRKLKLRKNARKEGLKSGKNIFIPVDLRPTSSDCSNNSCSGTRFGNPAELMLCNKLLAAPFRKHFCSAICSTERLIRRTAKPLDCLWYHFPALETCNDEK